MTEKSDTFGICESTPTYTFPGMTNAPVSFCSSLTAPNRPPFTHVVVRTPSRANPTIRSGIDCEYGDVSDPGGPGTAGVSIELPDPEAKPAFAGGCKDLDHFRAPCTSDGHTARVALYTLLGVAPGLLWTGGTGNKNGAIEVSANLGAQQGSAAHALAENLYEQLNQTLGLPAHI